MRILGAIVISLSFGLACGPKTPPVERIGADWSYLSRFRTNAQLPSLLVGEAKVLDGGCLAALSPEVEPAGDKVSERLTDKVEITRGFKAEIEASLEVVSGRTGVDVEKSKTALSAWEAEIEGISLATVPVSSVRANFTNEVCVLPELEWLTSDRDVVVQMVMAEKIRLKSGSDVDGVVKGTFDIAAQEATGHVGGEARFDWKKVEQEDESFAIEASNVYYGYVPTKLQVELCPERGPKQVTLAPGMRAEVCNLTFSVAALSATPDQYVLSVERRFGTTQEHLNEYGKRTLIPMGESRLVEARVDRPDTSGAHSAELAVWLVGPSGAAEGGGQ